MNEQAEMEFVVDLHYVERGQRAGKSVFQGGEEARDEGIEKAVSHANRKDTGWSDKAYELLKEYPEDEFMTEDVVEWAHALMGLREPPDLRAWGGVMRKAVAAGMVSHLCYRPQKKRTAHKAPKSVWRKNTSRNMI